jgi:alpha-ketoglutarate-dependent taurine dioxygenase
MAHVKIAPLHPSLGAAIEGVNLAEPVDERTRETLARALTDHLALVFHDQSLTPAKYGKPVAHPMVRTHPVHGSRAVYFHISKATHIDGMTPEASRAYMSDLLAR